VAAVAAGRGHPHGLDAQFRELLERAARDGGAGLARRRAEREREQAEPATQTAVDRARAPDRPVRQRGPGSPYVPATDPPRDLPKLRRHRHPRSRFEPAPSYRPPEL
jgi:hypothetical protein